MGTPISIQQMLTEMETGEPFSIKYIAYDRKRKKGGNVVELPEAQLLQKDPQKAIEAGRGLTRMEEIQINTNSHKVPAHRKHYTRNVRILQDGAETSLIRKIHPPLVIEFNGRKVIA